MGTPNTLFGWVEVHEDVVLGRGLRIEYEEGPTRHVKTVCCDEIPADRHQLGLS